MKQEIFHTNNRHVNAHTESYFARTELLMTFVSFFAALTFIIGSFMFLSPKWTTFGTYLFIIGSFCFALAPTIKLWREIRLVRMGDEAELASRES